MLIRIAPRIETNGYKLEMHPIRGICV